MPKWNSIEWFNKGTETIGDPQEEVFVAPSRPKPGEIIIPGNEISIPQPSPVDALTPVPVVPDASPLRPTDVSIYKVVRGDTLWGIARKNSISLSVLLSSNPLLSKSSKLSIGQEIMIPSGGSISESAAVIVPTGTADESSSSGTYVVGQEIVCRELPVIIGFPPCTYANQRDEQQFDYPSWTDSFTS